MLYWSLEHEEYPETRLTIGAFSDNVSLKLKAIGRSEMHPINDGDGAAMNKQTISVSTHDLADSHLLFQQRAKSICLDSGNRMGPFRKRDCGSDLQIEITARNSTWDSIANFLGAPLESTPFLLTGVA